MDTEKLVGLCRKLMAGNTDGFVLSDSFPSITHPDVPGFWFFGNIGCQKTSKEPACVWFQTVELVDVPPMGEVQYRLLHVRPDSAEWREKTKYGEGRCSYCGSTEFEGWECAHCHAV